MLVGITNKVGGGVLAHRRKILEIVEDIIWRENPRRRRGSM